PVQHGRRPLTRAKRNQEEPRGTPTIGTPVSLGLLHYIPRPTPWIDRRGVIVGAAGSRSMVVELSPMEQEAVKNLRNEERARMSGAGRRLGSKSSLKLEVNRREIKLQRRRPRKNEKAQATEQKNRDAKADAERAKNKANFLNSLAGGKTNSSEARRNRADESAQQSSGSARPQTRGPLDVSNSNNPASALGSNSVECIRVDNVSARPAIEITHRTISRRNDLHQATNVEANFDFDEEEAKKMSCDDLPGDSRELSYQTTALPVFPRFTHGSSSGRLAGAGGGVRLRDAVERPASSSSSAASADGGLAQVNEGNADQSRLLRLE
ncbi:hypothetical protein THAOC_01809, partial [Thalassiosira oceanica]